MSDHNDERKLLAQSVQFLERTALAQSRDSRRSIEDQFWAVDDLVCALAPDGDPDLYERWQELYDQMTPEFIAKRAKLRGVNITIPKAQP